MLWYYWSGRLDLNQRLPEPHSGALPGCATSRFSNGTILYRAMTLSRRKTGVLVADDYGRTLVSLLPTHTKPVHPANEYELLGDIPAHEENGDEVFSG